MVLLMGCSSGLLKPMGSYQPTGMALKYLLAGCPTIVANLWDVTDRDIDRFTERVIQVSVRVLRYAVMAELMWYCDRRGLDKRSCRLLSWWPEQDQSASLDFLTELHP